MALGKVLGAITHGHVGTRVEQRFPKKIFELNLPHAKSATVGVGGDRIPGHRFRPDHQVQLSLAYSDRVSRLEDRFNSGAANALYQVGRYFNGDAGINANVTGKHVGVERSLRHIPSDNGIDGFWSNA